MATAETATATKAIPNGPTRRTEPREVIGDSAIQDVRPGSTKEVKGSLEFEGLGYVDDFPDPIDAKNEEGVGTKCVILSDVVSGANGESYLKGQIHRISKLVNQYDDPDRNRVKAAVKRLVDLGAIRHATSEEITRGFAEVTLDSESESTQTERSKRLMAEVENQNLREEIAKLKAGTTDPFEGQ